MVKPVSLSDKAFAALRKEKREGESDSDVVLRLIRFVEAQRKDSPSFLRGTARRQMIDPEEHLRFVEAAREGDRDRDVPGVR